MAKANGRLDSRRQEFDRELLRAQSSLFAYARGLTKSTDLAEDLVQRTLCRALDNWEKFEPGSNMRAWTNSILRNIYFTDLRRNRFRGEYNEDIAEQILTVQAGQEEPIKLGDLYRMLLELPSERREALLLVGAGGFTYEEAAQICECAIGTIKSRVGRARHALAKMMANGTVTRRSVSDPAAYSAILRALSDLAERQSPAAAE